MSARLEHRRAATRHLAAVAPRAELDPSLTPPVPSAGIISIASALYPYVALDANAYFDDAGFDDEMSAQLQAKLTEYIQSADGVVPSPEEHPQPRRLARYLLENVDYEEVRLLLSPTPRSPPPPSSPPPLPPPSTPPRSPTPPPSPPAPFPHQPASRSAAPVTPPQVLAKPLAGSLLSGAKVNVVAVKPAGGGETILG